MAHNPFIQLSGSKGIGRSIRFPGGSCKIPRSATVLVEDVELVDFGVEESRFQRYGFAVGTKHGVFGHAATILSVFAWPRDAQRVAAR
jgi:hypothetical protein